MGGGLDAGGGWVGGVLLPRPPPIGENRRSPVYILVRDELTLIERGEPKDLLPVAGFLGSGSSREFGPFWRTT